MSTQRFTVVVEIDAENNTAQAFGEFNKGVNSTRKSSKLLDGVMNAVGQRLVGLAERLPQIAAQTFQLGIASQSATLRFERFAGGAERAEELLQAFQEATDDTVDKMGAMTSAARLLQMGLVTDADELANVAEIATKLGDQTASATNRISDFSLLLANQSIPRLDNFGISSGKVRARIAELQKQIQGLSREEAFKIAVMEEGRKSLVRLGDVSDTAAVKMDKLKAATKDAQVGFGELLVALVDNVGGVDELAGRIRRLPETFSQVIMLTTAWSEAVKVSRGNIFNFDEALETFNNSLGRQVAAQIDWKVATEETRFAFTIQREAVEDNIEVFDQYEENIGTYTSQSFLARDATVAHTESQLALEITILRTIEAIEAENEAAEALIVKQTNLAETLKDASKTEIATTAIRELGTLLDEDTITVGEYQQAVIETQLAFGLADEASINLSNRLLGLVSNFGEGKIAATEFDDELERLIELNEAENLQLEKFGTLLADMPTPIGTTTESLLGLKTSEDLAAESAEVARDFIEKQRESADELTEATILASAALVEFKQDIGRLPTVKTVTIRTKYETIGRPPPGIDINIPGLPSNVPGQQMGGFASGAFIAGEGGPEMIFAPRGAFVANAAQTRSITNNFTMNVNTPNAARVQDDFLLMQSLAQ